MPSRQTPLELAHAAVDILRMAPETSDAQKLALDNAAAIRLLARAVAKLAAQVEGVKVP